MRELANTTKYFLYARKSTDTEDRQITSIDDQIKEVKKLALSYGIQIIRVFEEARASCLY